MLVFSFVTTSNHTGLGDFHVSVFTDDEKSLTDSMSLQTPCICISQPVALSHQLWLYLVSLLKNRFLG